MAAPSTCVRSSASSASPKNITLPDLEADCLDFKLSRNEHVDKIAVPSDEWLIESGNLSAKKQKALRGLQCGLLTAMTYPDCPAHELRVCCDYLSYLFHLDDISDNMDDEGTLNTRRAVIESLRDPSFDTNARVGKMTKESVFL